MGKAEQLEFPGEPHKDDGKTPVPPGDRANFKFAVMRQAVGGDVPPKDGFELKQTSATREENEKITAQRRFAGK